MTLELTTVLRVVAAEHDELLAAGTASIHLALTLFCMHDDALHLLAVRQAAVGVATLTGVHQRLYTLLYRKTSCLLWVLLPLALSTVCIHVKAQFLQGVGMRMFLIASHTQIKIL